MRRTSRGGSAVPSSSGVSGSSPCPDRRPERHAQQRATAWRVRRVQPRPRAPRRSAGRSRARGRTRGASGRPWRGRSGRRRAAGPPRRTPARDRAPSATRRSAGSRPCPPSGLHLSALSTRFEIARWMRSGSPRTTVGSVEHLDRDAALRTRSAPGRPRSPRSRPREPRPRARRASRPRASSTMSATSAVSSSSSATMSARSDSRSAAGSRSACSSVWMLARRLAIGVRSSWLASATSWRCASTERSSASSVALKLRASRPSSSLPCASIL